MQEKIISELKKLATEINNIDSNTSVTALHKKAKSLYEKLTVLDYVSKSLEDTSVEYSEFESIIEAVQPEETLEDILSDMATPVFEAKEDVSSASEEEVVTQNTVAELPPEEDPEIEEPVVDEYLEAPRQDVFGDIFEAVIPEPETIKNDMEEVTPDVVEEIKEEPIRPVATTNAGHATSPA